MSHPAPKFASTVVPSTLADKAAAAEKEAARAAQAALDLRNKASARAAEIERLTSARDGLNARVLAARMRAAKEEFRCSELTATAVASIGKAGVAVTEWSNLALAARDCEYLAGAAKVHAALLHKELDTAERALEDFSQRTRMGLPPPWLRAPRRPRGRNLFVGKLTLPAFSPRTAIQRTKKRLRRLK